MSGLDRRQILPEPELPAVAELLAEGRRLARTVTVGDCPFLNDHNVRSESEYKRRRMAEGSIMLHAQFGYRSLSKSQRAYAEIYERIGAAGYRVDRYGICLDWSMGYRNSCQRHHLYCLVGHLIHWQISPVGFQLRSWLCALVHQGNGLPRPSSRQVSAFQHQLVMWQRDSSGDPRILFEGQRTCVSPSFSGRH